MHPHDFQQLGLGSHEAKVYGVLIEHSPAGASLIAKKAGLSRSSVYTTLGILANKGLVATTYKNEVKQFTATGADAFERLLARERDAAATRFQSFAGFKQHLELASRGDRHVPHVMLFEGVEGLQRIYRSMLRNAPDDATMHVLRDEFIWGDVWAFSRESEWREHVRRWKSAKRMRTRVLVNDSPLEQSKTAFYRALEYAEVRYLPAAHALTDFALYVLGDTAAIMSFETGNLIGIEVVNVNLAENFVRLFDGLWALAGAAPGSLHGAGRSRILAPEEVT